MKEVKKVRNIKVIVSVFLLSAALAGCAKTDATVNSEDTADSAAPVYVGVGKTENIQSEAMVPVLMFHDVKTFPGGEWSMSASNFRDTMLFLLEKGYSPVSFEKLVDYVDGKSGLPDKPVCITLDDGYFSNYKTVLPIATELNIPITVFMTCKTVREEGVIPDANENNLSKLSAAELKIMESSPLVQVESHTYGLHGMNTTYSDVEREYALPLVTESESAFKDIFAKDCASAEKVLADIGSGHTVLSYPGGRYHEWTEDVIRERGYRVSVTSDFGHKNLVVAGKPETLFMLGRMNVNDETTKEELLSYLERK